MSQIIKRDDEVEMKKCEGETSHVYLVIIISPDVSNPFAIREIGVPNMTGFPNKLTVEDGVVTIADRDDGLKLLPVAPLS